MEVAIGANNNNTTPFQREIREWQRVDPNTGALLSGRLEADRWINGPLNAYGKIVNSQNISQLNGIQQSQRNQLEVLQARTSSGSLQVVRAQTVQTMTSTSSPSTTTHHYWPSSSSQQSHSRNHTHSKQDNIFNDDDQRSYINGYRDHHLRLISNDGNISSDGNDDHHLTTSLNSNSNDRHSNRFLVTTPPSIKLSTLMKNNTAAVATNATTTITNGGDRKSPHISNNSMSLLQRHQHQQSSEQHEQQNKNNVNETPLSSSSSFTTDDRYRHHQPTITIVGETRHHRVGDVGIINTNQIQSLVRNERETNTLDQDYGKIQESSLSQQHRGRSISIDDLSTNAGGEWNHQNDDDTESSTSAEWRRVSKIRRSFQFPKTNSSSSCCTSPKTNVSRPIDLPENFGSVSRIRHELESGRRLSTAIRGNNVDLDALNSILNGTRENETRTAKKATFLTAESLKEIRGKLKKLSDESLYKDDFITQTNFPQEETNSEIENEARRNQSDYIIQQPIVLQDSQIVQQQSFQYQPKFDGNYTTNSLENRAKYRDTNSSEWHLRRKSYGFEKMTSSENPMFRTETSTDSGIGRSGDLANWSPTENTSTVLSLSNPTTNSKGQSNNNIQKTRVTLTSDERPVIIQRRIHSKNIVDSDKKFPEIKRHSIAVDETKYVGGESVRKAFEAKQSTSSSVIVNGFNTKDSNLSTQINVGTPDETGRRPKRVEFCKTEVHFAAESGRVNIVETDGKPPPTNNFRRRRRSSSTSSASGGSTLHNSYLETHNTSVPVIHFGDEQKVLFGDKDSRLGEIRDHKSNITISIPIKSDQSDRVLDPVKTVVEIEDESNSEEVSLRSILKNKPIKPKPYHLGESIGDSGESLWGIRLKPITKINYDEKDNRNYIKNNPVIDSRETFEPIKSVAERIKIVEERRDGSGYSTKINLNLSNSPHSWNVPEFSKTNIMSIELHSPSSSITRIVPSEMISSRQIEIPIPKPRTVSPVKIIRNTSDNEHDIKTINNTQQHEITTTERKSTRKSETLINDKEPLKVVTGGARKLREHELSYFGVKTDINSLDQKTKSSQRHNIVCNKNIVSSGSNTISGHTNNNKAVLNTEEGSKSVNGVQKWKLSSDKPDLLRHSPVVSKKLTGNTLPQESELSKINNDEGPIYENLKKPSTYNRKKDLKRDEMILDEMTKTADLTLKTVNSSSNKSHDQNHNQFQQRSSKPLDTINEKTASHQISSAAQKKIKSRTAQITRQHVTDNFQRPCCSNRPSSASSVESLTRYPKSKSRSQSKESSSGKIEYANIRSTKKLSTSSARDNSKSRHRSQSRERHYQQRTRSHSHHSSSDDLEGNPKIELIPRIRKPTKLTERDALGKDKERKRSTLAASSVKTKSHENSDHRQHSSKSATNENIVKLKKSTADRITDKVSSSKRSSPASTSDRHHIHSHNQHSSSHHSSSHNSGSQSSKVRTKSNQTGIITSTTSSPSNKHRTSKEHTRK